MSVKARESLLLGVWWRLNTLLTRAGTSRAIAILLGAFVLKRVASAYARQHHMPMTKQIVDFGWLALCVYTWVGPLYFTRELRRELQQVRLSKNY